MSFSELIDKSKEFYSFISIFISELASFFGLYEFCWRSKGPNFDKYYVNLRFKLLYSFYFFSLINYISLSNFPISILCLICYTFMMFFNSSLIMNYFSEQFSYKIDPNSIFLSLIVFSPTRVAEKKKRHYLAHSGN